MFIEYNFKNTDTNQQLKDDIANKLSKLSHTYPFLSRVDVIFEDTEDNKVCTIKTTVGDHQLKASSGKESFNDAIPICIANFRLKLEEF